MPLTRNEAEDLLAIVLASNPERPLDIIEWVGNYCDAVKSYSYDTNKYGELISYEFEWFEKQKPPRLANEETRA